MITAALWLAGAACACAWSAQPQVAAWRRLTLIWARVVAGGPLAAWSYLRAREGVLAWDGAASTWTERGRPAAVGRVQPRLDLQHVLLLRWHDGASGCSLWLERRRCGGHWDDLRRAVYSRARPEALPAAEPPAAKP